MQADQLALLCNDCARSGTGVLIQTRAWEPQQALKHSTHTDKDFNGRPLWSDVCLRDDQAAI